MPPGIAAVVALLLIVKREISNIHCVGGWEIAGEEFGEFVVRDSVHSVVPIPMSGFPLFCGKLYPYFTMIQRS